jgi:hypothetical protein
MFGSLIEINIAYINIYIIKKQNNLKLVIYFRELSQQTDVDVDILIID